MRKPDNKLTWQSLNRPIRWSLIVVTLATLGISAHAKSPPSDDLGTLFYSPAERSAITRARDGNTPDGPQSNLLVVNGVVKRQYAKGTAWINGEAISEGSSAQSIRRVRIINGGVTLDGNPVRVGEKLELTTGQKIDIVEPDAVSVTRRK